MTTARPLPLTPDELRTLRELLHTYIALCHAVGSVPVRGANTPDMVSARRLIARLESL